MRPDEQRVVVTGLGIVSSLGDTVPSFWEALVAGRSGITSWKSMDPRVECRIGGDMSDFDIAEHFARRESAYPARAVQTALKLLRTTPLSGRLTSAAALQTMLDAGLFETTTIERDRIGHVLAGHNLHTAYLAENVRTFIEDPEFIDPLFGMMSLDTDSLSVASELVQVMGPSFMVGGACASGNLALLAGVDLLRAGRVDAVLVSGGAIALEPLLIHAWANIDALTFKSFNDAPTRASRPFDARREGFVPSEGAAGAVLESLASARRRGAPIYAEVLGGASASDACRLTKPNRAGQERAMRRALADARVDADAIDYVNAHATSTPLGDVVEVEAIKAVLGARAAHIPINATKSMVGHTLTAAGVIELVATVLQMKHGVVHPTINQEEPDPELDLDFVPNTARDHTIRVAMSNSFGFGGLNSTIVLGAAP
jgi:3-oxoacyl-(acyl-carrier-protein) synthase